MANLVHTVTYHGNLRWIPNLPTSALTFDSQCISYIHDWYHAQCTWGLITQGKNQYPSTLPLTQALKNHNDSKTIAGLQHVCLWENCAAQHTLTFGTHTYIHCTRGRHLVPVKLPSIVIHVLVYACSRSSYSSRCLINIWQTFVKDKIKKHWNYLNRTRIVWKILQIQVMFPNSQFFLATRRFSHSTLRGVFYSRFRELYIDIEYPFSIDNARKLGCIAIEHRVVTRNFSKSIDNALQFGGKIYFFD